MMHLRDDWEQRFRADLAAFEEQTQMPYITSVERLAKAEGRAEGGIGVLLRQLECLCGPVPADIEQRIRRLSYAEAETLSEAVLGFRTWGDVRQWLEAHPPRVTDR